MLTLARFLALLAVGLLGLAYLLGQPTPPPRPESRPGPADDRQVVDLPDAELLLFLLVNPCEGVRHA